MKLHMLTLALFLSGTVFPLHASALTLTDTFSGDSDTTAEADFLTAVGCMAVTQGCPNGAVGYEDFDSLTATNSLSGADISATDDAFTITVIGTTTQGVVNTPQLLTDLHAISGSNYVRTATETTVGVTFDFGSTQITEFGLWVVDFDQLGESGSVLRLSVGDQTFDCAGTGTDVSGGTGSEIFCGFISDTAFSEVTLTTTSGLDALGLDSVYFTPEPGSGFLVASGLLGLALRRRSRGLPAECPAS